MQRLNDAIKMTLFESMLDGSQVATVVTDPRQEDNPIIYTNRTFEKLSGYSREEIIGKNCRFLQGGLREEDKIARIRAAIQAEEPVTETLRNFRKDGRLFWNRLYIEPVRVEGQLFFIGTQTDVTVEEQQRELLDEKDEEINRLMLPILPIDERLAAVSLVGKMSSERFDILTEKLSEYVQRSSADTIIIDISGILWDKTFPAERLLMIQDVLRLMGSQLYLTGISPQVAMEIAQDRQANTSILSFSTVQQAIRHYTMGGE